MPWVPQNLAMSKNHKGVLTNGRKKRRQANGACWECMAV